MAGPAIRCWEFAKELSKYHHVTILSQHASSLQYPDFKIKTRKCKGFLQSIKEADLIIAQFLPPTLAALAKFYGVRLILDAYCPITLEAYEFFKNDSPAKHRRMINKALEEQLYLFHLADGIICASERQKDLWMGLMLASGKLNSQIEVVPFGLDPKPIPEKNGPGPREIFQLGPNDKILIWGGSISNWFDPSTLVKAMSLVNKERNDIKLVFLGVKHPNPLIPEMAAAVHAIELSKQLDLFNKNVFFNFAWTPYASRHNFLRESAIGISIHGNHLETRYSFRTRILDYLWAGLPIISTEGDFFAELTGRKELGILVPYYDERAIAKAIIQLVDDKQLREKYQANVESLKAEYQWDRLIKPLQEMINKLAQQPAQDKLNLKNAFKISRFGILRLYYFLQKLFAVC